MGYKVRYCERTGLEEFLNANEDEGWAMVQAVPVEPQEAPPGGFVVGKPDTMVIFHRVEVTETPEYSIMDSLV